MKELEKPKQPTEPSSPKPRLRDSTKILRQRIAALHAHENIYTLPNFLTASRLIAAPIVGYLVLHDQHLPAVALFAYAGLMDLVDGWIARKWNLQTVIGTVIDPMADKALMTILVVCLAIKGALPRRSSMYIQMNTNTEQFGSLSCNYYSWSRRLTSVRSLLLSLCLTSNTQNLCTLLGLLVTLR
jgi:phosphatidylglycerophosphate synthase